MTGKRRFCRQTGGAAWSAAAWSATVGSAAVLLVAVGLLGPTGCDTKKPAADGVKLPVIPPGLPAVAIPADNPMTAAKVELGKLLYFDTRLSKDGTISCATCHDPTKGWAETTKTSKGIAGQVGGRNSPTVINAAYYDAMFWDGRAKSLEEQALGPIENPIEMGHAMVDVIAELKKDADYQKRFQEVFGGTEITNDHVAKAIAAFERTILSGDSPYDKHVAGDEKALSDAQKRGLQLFMDHCNICHSKPIFSNMGYYSAGIGMDAEKPDIGRMEVTKSEGDKGKFRVPALREIANTAPYFHDGSAATLEDAVEIMASGGKDDPNLSSTLKVIREAKLTAENKQDLVEFLKALSGVVPKVEPPK